MFSFRPRLLIVALGLLVLTPQPARADIDTAFTFHYRDRELGLFDRVLDFQIFGVAGLRPAPGAGTTGTYEQADVTGSLHAITCCPDILEEVRPFDPLLSGPWELHLRSGAASRTVATPPLWSSVPMPFVQALRVSGDGLSPVLSWDLPDDVNIGRVDVSVLRPVPGEARYDPLLYAQLAEADTSFRIPEGLLAPGQAYRLAVNLFDPTFSQRSLTAVSYVPFSGAMDEAGVFLPVVRSGPGGVPTFEFLPIPVSQGIPIRIDPVVVEGYDYAIGAGNPLFASVLLPEDIGDGTYELSYADVILSLRGGVEYTFTGGGTAAFSVRGIEPDAGLSPDDPTAFVTTLTFASDGLFSGTMTPVTVPAIPEPSTLVLLSLGLAGVLRVRARGTRVAP